MRIAVLLNGAVSKITGKFDNPGQLYRPGEYINYRAVYNSIARHIIRPNTDWKFDFFIHCWNTDLESDLTKIYRPVAAQFEDNNQYRDEILQKLQKFNAPEKQFAVCSRSLSVAKVCELVDYYVETTGTHYDLVMLYRPDILLWKDINLNRYDPNSITCSSSRTTGEFSGDFHHVMSLASMGLYKHRYKTDSYPSGWSVYSHDANSQWMQLLNRSGVSIAMDDVEAGVHQAPVRYINANDNNLSAIKQGHITIDQMLKYGFSRKQIDSYVTIWGEGIIP